MKRNWERKHIADICEKASSNIALNKLEGVDGDYPVYGASGFVQNVDFYQRDTEYIGIIKDGSGVGRVNTYPAFSSLLGTMQYILPKDGYLLSFVSYALKSLNLASFASGAAIPHIYFKDYSKCQISVPPFDEQSRIVAELDLLTGIIDKQNAQLKELDNLAQAIFYDMFGDPIENPKGWEVKKLESLGDLGRGVSKHRPRNAPELLGGTMPLIQTGDVANANYLIRDYASTYSELGVAQSKVWPKGTLCITIAATIGKCAILDFEACFPDSVVGFTPNNFVDRTYIYFIFCNMQKMLEDFAPGVAQKNINLAILNSLLVPLPPLALQQSFAEKIQSIEKQKESIRASIADTQKLLDYTMDKYFG